MASSSSANNFDQDVEAETLSRRPATTRSTFGTQATALLRKNIVYQKRNWATNCCLISMPILLCIGLFGIQLAINSLLNGDDFKCGCRCVQFDSQNSCLKKECGVQYSKDRQAAYCAVASTPEWPAFQQIGAPQYRAVETDPTNYAGLPSSSCRTSGNCPVSFLYTGNSRSVADEMMSYLFEVPSNKKGLNSEAQAGNYTALFATLTPASSTNPPTTWQLESAFTAGDPGRNSTPSFLQKNCSSYSSGLSVDVSITSNFSVPVGFSCLEAVTLWRSNSSAINKEMYAGYYKSDVYSKRQINEIAGGYDMRNTNPTHFDVNVYVNYTYANDTGPDSAPPNVVRFARALNLAADAFARLLTNGTAGIPLLFVKEFPKPATRLSLNFSSILGPLFFMWLIQLLFPVILSAVVYEKQQNLRTMMKMHGLGDSAYWSITYLYFIALSSVYMLFFVLFGSGINLKFFRLNSYLIQLVFYFVFCNTQVAFAFLASTIFKDVRTVTVVGYLYVFGTGLLGQFLFSYFLEDKNFSRAGVFAMELIPAFSLYRGLYEFSQYSFIGDYLGTTGMKLSNLSDSDNGIVTVTLILLVEWAIFFPLALYLDQVVVSGSGVRKHPLFFLHGWLLPKPRSALEPTAVDATEQRLQDSNKADVEKERELVESLRGNYAGFSVICDNLRKVYPPRDGNPAKYAVREMSLAIPTGECFGMLGPNGAGKTTSINMMIGFLTPTSGKAVVNGLDITQDMQAIYSTMGVCPQHDLLWEQLTGREHLLFYGRLKNLKGAELVQAVDESLRSVNLFNVGNKKAGQYSGGMKRRLSVAISLIGNPQVVYMDEPSTGLDPASRMNLWSVVKKAKKDRAIILTTHSMEEAEALCDRIGIFVNGEFECVGNPKEIATRYGSTFVFTITTPIEQQEEVRQLALSLSPSAKKVYQLSGTQKFELPVTDVEIADVFQRIEDAKSSLTIQAWGISHTTLEDVFIKIAKK